MSTNGRVEVEFELVPERPVADAAEVTSEGFAFGFALELAMHAVETALPGYGIEPLRYGSPLALQEPRRCRAVVEPSTRRVVVESWTAGTPQLEPERHLEGSAARLVEHGWLQRLRDALRRGRRPGRALVGAQLEAELRAAGGPLGSLPRNVARVVVYDDGVEAELCLAASPWPPYRLHPAIVSSGWSIASFWESGHGRAGVRAPIHAEAAHVLEPGARADRVWLVQLPAEGRSYPPALALAAARGDEITAVLYGLTLGPRAPAVASRGELAGALGGRPPAERRGRCAAYVERLVRDALDDRAFPQGLPQDVPFRELGVTSAQAVAIASALGEALDRPVPSTVLFDHPTLDDLVGAILAGPLGTPPPRPKRLAWRARDASAHEDAIAVIGMGCRFPGGIRSPDDYWRALIGGVDAVGPVPAARCDLIGGFRKVGYALGAIDDIELFDARFFGIASREAIAMDPQHRLLLEVSWHALEDAGLVPADMVESRTGVFVGVASAEYNAIVRELDAYTVVGNAQSVAAGRLSYFFGFRGPNMCIDSACSSSLVSIALACESLQREESELAIAGGVNLTLDPRATEGLAAAGVLSPTGKCRAFDDAADGYVRGEGCGIVVLRRLRDALARGERVLAVVRGHAVNHGGRGNGLAAPNKSAQVELIRSALDRASIDPSEVGYVEAHGTGTIIGDAVELHALSETYGAASGRGSRIWIGSAKTNMGHLETAAGVAGFMKAVLILQHGYIPRHLHVETPSSAFDWEHAAMAIAAEPQPFPPEQRRRLVAVNSFGISGTNAHALLEAFEQESPPSLRVHQGEPCLIPISGRSDASLRALCTDYADFLERGGEPSDLARTAGRHRQHMELRAAVVGTGARDLAAELRAVAAQPEAASAPRSGKPKVAFLFSGQGTQYVGMGRALYEHEPVFRDAIAECDEIVAAKLGKTLRSLLYGSDADAGELQRTSFAQPALFAFEYALTRLWRSWGVEPDFVMGHSLGEYVAAHVAGVFDLCAGLMLMHARGRLMESLARRGAMAALSLSEAEAEEALRSLGGRVAIAALNGPQQVVVSGAAELVAGLCAELTSHGVTAQPLSVAYGFHSELVDPILDRLEALATDVRMQPPQRKLVSNLTGHLVDTEVCSAKYWRDHSRLPVRFSAGLQALRAEGADAFVEIGPQPVLLGLAAASPARAECLWLPSIRKHGDDQTQMLRSAAHLYVAGHELDFANLPGARHGRFASAPVYRYDRSKYWAAAEEPCPADTATSMDWHYAVGWKAQHIPSQGPRAASWLIAGRNDELAERLKAQLTQYGVSVAIAESEAAIESELRGARPPDGVVHVPSLLLRDGELDGDGLLEATAAASMQTAAIVRALARYAPQTRLWIVTRAGQQVESEDVDVVSGSIWSLGRAIGVEHPNVWGGLIDLEPSFRPEDLDLLCRSVLWSDGENQIALRGGHRYVARLRRMHVAKSSGVPALSGELTYVVTGGLGHVGLLVARFLVGCGARHLILISRRGLTAHGSGGGAGNQLLSRQNMLQELRAQGASVRLAELDVCDRDGLRRLLQEAEPKVGAVFHAAGTNDDQPIIELDEARLRAVLRSKTAGSWTLHELTQGDGGPQLVLFSSFAATLAPVGRSAYAVANGFLDALACHRRHLGLHAVSIGWGLWGGDGGMAVTEDAVDVMASVGIGAMDPRRALDALGRALDAGGSGCRVVADVDWQRYLRMYGLLGHHPILTDLSPADAGSAEQRSEFLQQLSSMSELERVQALCSRLTAELSRVVVADDLDPDRNFGELGLDSLGVLQMRSRIQSLLGLTVSPMVVVQNPSLRRLAQALSSELGSGR